VKEGFIIITAIGKNRIGVLSEITTQIAKLNGNIMDISQKILKDYFNLVMFVDISKSKVSFQTFKEKLENLGKIKKYNINVYHSKTFEYIHRI
jgi:ACT domain-containing protein